MTFLNLIPVISSFLLLAAHFFRAGLFPLVGLALLLPLLLLIRNPMAARVVQAALLLAAGEWLRTMATFALARAALGLPWLRLAVILGAVALLTAAAALLFKTSILRRRYQM